MPKFQDILSIHFSADRTNETFSMLCQTASVTKTGFIFTSH